MSHSTAVGAASHLGERRENAEESSGLATHMDLQYRDPSQTEFDARAPKSMSPKEPPQQKVLEPEGEITSRDGFE